MNLHRMLLERQAAGNSLRVGLIGAGKFGSMYLAQARVTPGIHLVGIADLSGTRGREACARTGWPAEAIDATTFARAARGGKMHICEDAMAPIESPLVDIVIDASGSSAAGIAHVLACCEHRKHIVMVNVEADALAGPLLAHKAE